MEKKRRARINKSLDQLKSLLESYYSTSVSMQTLIQQSFKKSFNLWTEENQPATHAYTLMCNYFPHADSKAETGEGRHLGAHSEPPEKPPKDPEL